MNKLQYSLLLLFVALLASCDNKSKTAGTAADSLQVEKKLPDSLTISMVGDIMMGTTFPVNKLPENGGANLFDDCKSILQNSDMAVGNLECAMLTGGNSRKRPGPFSFAFRTPPEYAQWLVEAGFDFLGTANNHAFDFYEHGGHSTRDILDSVGIASCGWAGDRTYQIVERKGVKFGLTAFSRDTYNLCSLDSALVDSIIRDLRPRCDVLVVSLHAGNEGSDQIHVPDAMEYFRGEPRGYVRKLTRQMVDAGADVVYCHGPHVPRCVNVYKGKFIAYSLGNFCTVSMGIASNLGLAPLIKITIDGKGNFLNGKIYSFRQFHQYQGPRKDEKQQVAQLLKRLTAEDFPDSPLTFDDDGNISLKK